MNIVSYDGQMLFGALLTGGVAAYWIAIDSVRLRRAIVAFKKDRADLTIRDRVFGSVVGILVGILGVFGSLNYYYW
jgi:hypothetical protein